MNMAVSLVPSLGCGNCRHFCPYLRLRCVWFSAVHARKYARMHSQIASPPPPPSRFPVFHPRVWYVPWCLVALISGNFVKGAQINRAGTPRRVLFPFYLLPRGTPEHFSEHQRCEGTEKSDLADYLCALGSGYSAFKIQTQS